jgi:hypothetical protein
LHDPAFNIINTTPFLFEGKVRKVSLGIDDNIGTAEIEFPTRPFGTHINFVTPIAIAADNADNIFFRGFLDEEEGILDTGTDQLNALAFDYKWLIGKLSKIRGKIFTIDNVVKPGVSTTASDRVFLNPRLYEKFKYLIADADPNGDKVSRFQRSDATGFLGNVKTIFNENGNPDCATRDINSSNAIAFKFSPDPWYYENLRFNAVSGNVVYHWTYSTMLAYVAKYYIENIFEGLLGTTRIIINYDSLIKILRYGERNGLELIIPKHFDITGLSPAQAIDKIVKAIPGSWHWRLYYYTNVVLIDINNNTAEFFENPGKALFIGDGGKINDKTNNNVNVRSIRAKRSVKDSVSHAIAIGSPLQIETTIQLNPGWQQYLKVGDDDFEEYNGGPIPGGSYISDFKHMADYENWLQFLHSVYASNTGTTKRLRETIDSEDELRYAQLFRVFVFPETKEELIKSIPVIPLNLFYDTYRGFADWVHELFFSHILLRRKVLSPITDYRQSLTARKPIVDANIPKFKNSRKNKNNILVETLKESKDPPFIFLFDSQISTAQYTETGGNDGQMVTDILEANKILIPDSGKLSSSESDGLNYSIENDNRVVIFEQPQFERKTASFAQPSRTVHPSFDSFISRKVFMTCRIECEVPIVEDGIKDRFFYGNARLVTQDINENAIAVIRTRAYYPVPKNRIGDSVSFVPSSNSQVGELVNDGSSSSIVGAKIIDWNKVDGFDEDAVLIVDDTEQLKQMVQIMLNDSPLYYETIEVNLGRADLSYYIGDRISRIIGSELEDGSGGYYNMKALIESLDFVAEGETDAFTVNMSLINNIPPTQRFIEERRK